MIITKFRSKKHTKVKARYVRKAAVGNLYEWCEQSADDPRYDVAQGICTACDLPREVRKKCDEHAKRDDSFYACEWPL